MEKNKILPERIEKNETLYEKVEDKMYKIYSFGTTALMTAGGISLLDGYLSKEKVLTALGYALLLAGGMWKLGAFSSENRFKSVSGLESKIEE